MNALTFEAVVAHFPLTIKVVVAHFPQLVHQQGRETNKKDWCAALDCSGHGTWYVTKFYAILFHLQTKTEKILVSQKCFQQKPNRL